MFSMPVFCVLVSVVENVVDAISKVKSNVAKEATKAGQQMLEWLKTQETLN